MDKKLESRLLAKGIGEIGGILSYWVALLLPSKAYEETIETTCTKDLANNINVALLKIGSVIPECPSDINAAKFCALVGSGRKNMNPSILYVDLDLASNPCALSARCVAKEGLINQNSSQKTIQRFKHSLKELMPNNTFKATPKSGAP